MKIVQLPKSDTFIGDVIFITEQDLIDFKEKGYKKIKGNLTIEGEKLKTLQTLDNLITDIEGDKKSHQNIWKFQSIPREHRKYGWLKLFKLYWWGF